MKTINTEDTKRNRKFYDENTDSIITMDEVRAFYQEAKADGYTESFAYWFNCVQSRNNGSLTEVYKYSMTVWNEDADRYEDIVAIGSNPEDACNRYAIDNDLSEIIPIDSRIIRE